MHRSFAFGLIVAMAFAVACHGLRAQPAEKAHTVTQSGLTLEGRVNEHDAKLKVAIGARTAMLPAQRFVVKLAGGKAYRVTMDSGHFDAFLVIQDEAGRQITYDDDSGGGLNSALSLAVAEDATYQIFTASLKGTGVFVLKVRETDVIKIHEVGNGIRIEDNLGIEPAKEYLVKFNKGKDYVIDMESADPKALDPFLRLLDSHGNQLAEDDDGGGSFNARIVFYAEATAPYRIAATRFGRGKGAFVLRIAEQPADRKNDDKAKLAEALRAMVSAMKHYERGEYGKAIPLVQQAFELRKQVQGEKHPNAIVTLNNLALLLYEQGDFAKAEPLFRKVLELHEEVLGRNDPHYAQSLLNLANLHNALGDNARAEPLLRRALEAYRQLPDGEKQPNYASGLSNLGDLYRQEGEYEKAEPLLLQALELRRKYLGEKNPDYAKSLYSLANLYAQKRELAKAETHVRKALDLYRRNLDANHPYYAQLLDSLAKILFLQGNYNESESLFRQSLDLFRLTLGEKHRDFSRSLASLARLYAVRGDTAKAEPLARQAVILLTEHLAATASVQAEQSQIAHLDVLRPFLDQYLTCTASSKTADATYDLVLRWKGAITTRQRHTRLARAALAGGDVVTNELFAQLETVSRQYARLAQNLDAGKSAGDLSQRLERLERLEQQRERVEIDLSRRTESFRRLRESQQLTPKQLQDSLPVDVALIDFLVYQRVVKTEGVDYLVAYVITPKVVRRVELGVLAPIQNAVDAFRDQMLRHPPTADASAPGHFLRKTIWQPLLESAANAKLVLLAPDGPLCRLPFAALPSADGTRFLIEETSLSILPVPQMLPELLIANDVTREKAPSLLAMGGVDFDFDPGSSRVSIATKSLPTANRRPITDAARAGKTFQWKALPGAEGEVADIERLFKKGVPDGQLTLLKKGAASKRAFREQAGNHQYLHLATHGFFADRSFRSTAQGEPKEGAAFGERIRPRAGVYHPGVLSGIVLAGANNPRDDDDGIMTALEVAELDLSNVKLAVLSACETGLGETAGGEGALGLQRAFQIAGARTTVTTLWKVSDDATRSLMERFYENRWKKGMSPLESLRQAQLAMLRCDLPRGNDPPRGAERDDERPGERRAIPYYWAAFVLSGDWR